MRMSLGQWRKLDVVERVERGELTVGEGALLLGISRRQAQRRLRKKVRLLGPKGVLHGNAGRPPKHKTAELVAARVVELRREKYGVFNDQHFTEKLAEVEGLTLSRQRFGGYYGRLGSARLDREGPLSTAAAATAAL